MLLLQWISRPIIKLNCMTSMSTDHPYSGQTSFSALEQPCLLPLQRLTPRQSAVLKALLQGQSNKGIAREIGISVGTVKAHLWAAYQILGVQSRAQAICKLHLHGLAERLRTEPGTS